MIISKIEVQKKNKQRVNLFLDGNFYCGLSCETVVKNKIKEGLEITQEQVDFLKNETEKEIALTKALNVISKSSKTVKQINEYLLKKGFEEDAVNYVVAKLLEYNYINDETFAKNYVKFKTKTNGKRKILMELKHKGVEDALAITAIDDFSKDEENINAIAEKYLKSKPRDLKTKQKAFRYLTSRGYTPDVIIKSLNKFFKEEVENESWD